jgi:hypothetical protein
VYLAEKSNDIKDITDESFPISDWPESSVSTSHIPITKMVSNLYLRFNDESIATRVAEAFKHAAQLCQQAEPF